GTRGGGATSSRAEAWPAGGGWKLGWAIRSGERWIRGWGEAIEWNTPDVLITRWEDAAGLPVADPLRRHEDQCLAWRKWRPVRGRQPGGGGQDTCGDIQGGQGAARVMPNPPYVARDDCHVRPPHGAPMAFERGRCDAAFYSSARPSLERSCALCASEGKGCRRVHHRAVGGGLDLPPILRLAPPRHCGLYYSAACHAQDIGEGCAVEGMTM